MWVDDLNDCFVQFCELRERILAGKSVEGIKFMYPTTLVPLLPYIENGISINPDVKGYVSSISKSVNPNSGFALDRIKKHDKFSSKMDCMIDELSTGHDKNTLQYFFTELYANIHDHSGFTNAFAMAQTYRRKKFVEFCLYDDGITIPGSLKNYDDTFKSLEDCELINRALNGESSKSKEKSRGFGINSSAQVIVDGYGGELFIASMDGSIHIKPGDKDPTLYVHDNNEHFRTNGTLVGLRIPQLDEKVSCFPFLETKRPFTRNSETKRPFTD